MQIAIFHDLPSGGAKRTLFETAKILSEKHTLDVYSLSTADENFCDLRPFVNQYESYLFTPRRHYDSPLGRLNQLQRWRDLKRLDQLAQEIALDIDAQGYDVVLAEPCMWTQAPILLRYLETPALYYCQEPSRSLYEPLQRLGNDSSSWRSMLNHIDPLIPLYRSTAKWFDKSSTRAAQVVLVNSKFSRDAVSRIYGIVPQVCYHGVDTDLFHPLPEVKSQSYVLSVGAIQPNKGFDFLIQSLGYLPESNRPTLKLIGNSESPGECQYLNFLAQKHGVDLQIHVGVGIAKLIEMYNEAALLVYTPYNEPFGLVPLESMASGTPVVAVREGGIIETVVHERTGLLTEREPAKFADAVNYLLNNPLLAKDYGNNGRNYVLCNWSWDRSVKTLEHHLSICAEN